jgi:hypothetical protein
LGPYDKLICQLSIEDFYHAVRNPLINGAIERSLSRDRLEKYLATSGNDIDPALALYERNTRLAAAFYAPLQTLEICLRNHLDEHLRATYKADWMTNGIPPLNDWAQREIRGAEKNLGAARRAVTRGAIVAELHFGFWISLLAPQYDATLWRSACHKAFRANGKGLARKVVHGRFNAIRRFRNRVAHHEPIFHADLQRTHDEIIEACAWICGPTAAWAQHHSDFSTVFAGP